MQTTSNDCLASLIDEPTPPGERLWTIGELSRECGVTLRALRFYEGKNLLRPSRDGTARYYDENDRRRLKIIVRAKRVGFSLVEVRDLLDLVFSSEPASRRLQVALERLARQVENLEEQRREAEVSLTTIRQEISALEARIGA